MVLSLFSGQTRANTSAFASSEWIGWQPYTRYVIDVYGESDDNELLDLIFVASSVNGVDPYLVLSVAHRESRLSRKVVNRQCNCHGPMQISESTFRAFWNPKGNIRDSTESTMAGIALLAEKLRKFHDVRVALLAYNGGDGYAKRMRKLGKVNTPYVRSILAHANELRRGEKV